MWIARSRTGEILIYMSLFILLHFYMTGVLLLLKWVAFIKTKRYYTWVWHKRQFYLFGHVIKIWNVVLEKGGVDQLGRSCEKKIPIRKGQGEKNILHTTKRNKANWTYLQMIPIRQFIYNLTDKFFARCPVHSNPLIRNTGNYTLEDLHRQYTKYRHKRTKHILLWLPSALMLHCFFFSCCNVNFFTVVSINVVSTSRIFIA